MASDKLYDATEINTIIEDETKKCIESLKADQSRLDIKRVSGELSNIKYKLLRKDTTGVFTRIRFIFPRYGVFIEKGAGRGHGGGKGSQWKNKRDITIYTNPASFGKMNTGGRRAKEWFNPVIENFVDSLVDRLQGYFISVSYQRLKIK